MLKIGGKKKAIKQDDFKLEMNEHLYKYIFIINNNPISIILPLFKMFSLVHRVVVFHGVNFISRSSVGDLFFLVL